jgi:hypothetical protein
VFKEDQLPGRRQPTKNRSRSTVRIGHGTENPRCHDGVEGLFGKIRPAHARLQFENPAHRGLDKAVAAFGQDPSLAAGE